MDPRLAAAHSEEHSASLNGELKTRPPGTTSEVFIFGVLAMQFARAVAFLLLRHLLLASNVLQEFA